jgi:hypothetical protein
MNGRWYYSHADATYGPFSVEEIKECITQKMLVESDWVWQDGVDVRLRAASVFDFSPPAGVSPVPDWLADVVEVKKKGLLSTPSAIKETPEWLEDLRLWIALEQYEPGWEAFNKTAESTASTPSQAGGIPDGLASWSVPAAPKESSTASPRSPVIPVSVPASPTVGPVFAPPAAKPPIPAPPVLKVPKPAAPTPPATETKPAAFEPAKTLAEQMLEASGFDSETGQILDAQKFRQWKQQQARSSSANQPGVSNASLFEVFRKGRTAIEAWVDDESNILCMLHAEPDELKRNREVQAILDAYANYGQDFQEKLLRHLEFMVNNRRKYYQAAEGRSSYTAHGRS